MTAMIWIAAALSGGAALAYEVCWSRALVVPLGNSMDAAALVLVGFMLGIAVGARWGGRLSARAVSPLRTYAALEGVLALFAIVAPWLLARLSAVPFVFVRCSAALVVIVVPCLAMGASLPLLARALTLGGERLGERIGVVYGVNTIGAAIGAIGTGFFGISRVGVARTSMLAAVASALAAAVAILAAAVGRSSGSRASPESPEPKTNVAPCAESRTRAAVAAFVAGFVMLACELLWSRVLTFVFGHDTYAFATLLAVVLVGLALGGGVHRATAKLEPTRVVFVALALFGVVLLASYWGAAALVVRRGRDPFGVGASSDLAVSVRIELYRAIAFTPILVLAPAILSGVLFPAACTLRGGDAGRAVGTIGLVNGIGSAAGVVVVALGLVRVVGLQRSFVALALVCALAAAFVHARGTKRSLAVSVVPILAVVAIAVAIPHALPEKMLLQSVGARHQQLLHYEESRTATVSVIRNDINGEKQLLMNAVNEVTTRLVHDQSFALLGHLGPLLHANPKTAIMICLGAGLSAGATMTHDLERLDVVDLSSAVQNGARLFSEENHHVLDDPRMHLHIDDGRQFLLNARESWDVAIIDSTHPKAVDSWILYTKDFYDLVRARLPDGGVVVQWLPLHGLSEREFKIIVRTFLESFPEMTLWANAGFETYGPVAYAKLVAVKNRPFVVDHAQLSRRLAEPKVHDALAPFGMATPEEILDLFLADANAVRAWTEGLPVQTDDHPIVPYTTTFSEGRRMEPSLLLAVREPIAPFLVALDANSPARAALDSAYEAQGLVIAGLIDRAQSFRPESETIRRFVAQLGTTLEYYRALAERYPDDVDKLLEAANQLATLGHPDEAKDVYRRAFAVRPSDFRVRLNFALLLDQLHESKEAIAVLSKLRDEEPTSAVVLYDLGAALLDAGDAGAASVQLELALQWDPTHDRARLALAVARLALGDLDRAEKEATHVARDNPFIAEAHDLLGVVAMRRGDFDRAVSQHLEAIRLQPYRSVSHYDLAVALRTKGDLDRAETEYLAALHIDPRFAAAELELGLTRSAAGKGEGAVDAFCRALAIDPSLERARAELKKLQVDPTTCGS